MLIPLQTAIDGNRQAWLEDPDGNRIELMEMAPDCLQYEAIRRLRAEAATGLSAMTARCAQLAAMR